MKNRILFLLALLISTAIVINACKKDEKEEDPEKPDQDLSQEKKASEESLEADAYANDVYANVFAGDSESNKGLTTCATVTLEPGALSLTFPKTLTIDFGTSGCVGEDGRTRSGKIIAILSGKLRDQGSTVTISLENYNIDTMAITGTFLLTNNGEVSGNKTFTYDVDSMTVTGPSGTFHYNSTKTFSWIAGQATILNVSDDVYSVTGNNTYVNTAGETYTFNITTALNLKVSCQEIVSGVATLDVPGMTDLTIDFGDGNCDGVATMSTNITVAGYTYTYTETVLLF